MAGEPKLNIPVLTDTVGEDPGDDSAEREPMAADTARIADREALIAELQTQIAAGTFALTDEILRTAFAEMEASIFEKISGRLRRELPEMIDSLLRENIGEDPDY
jgi:hypothetical protein